MSMIRRADIVYALGYVPYDAANPSGYVTPSTMPPIVGVSAFNGRAGPVVMGPSDVTNALGYTPADAASVSGFLTNAAASITYQPALGFIAYDAANPAGYQTAADRAAVLLSYATLSSPALSGTPSSPTPPLGDNSTRLATTAFVAGSVAAATTGVSAFNGRTGNISLTSADIATSLSYIPYPSTNPSNYLMAAAAATTYQRALGYTAYNAANPAGYQTGPAVLATLGSYAPLLSPALAGVPTAPTAVSGTATVQVATTAFVASAVVASTTGVSLFNGRTGRITLSVSDIQGALNYTPYNASNPSGYLTAATVVPLIVAYDRGLHPLFSVVPLNTAVGDGATTGFSLSNAATGASASPGSPYELLVTQGGAVKQGGLDYVVSGSNIAFAVAPPAGVSVFILWLTSVSR